jgi:hypothetical protein
VGIDARIQDFDLDAFNVEQQEVYDMALTVDLWGDLGTLWPETGGTIPQYFSTVY